MSLTHPDRLEVHHDSTEQPAPEPVTPQSPAVRQPPTNRPTFTITDAASACAVSRKTITRKLPELAGHGAAKDEDGVWRIPVEALLAVGLRPGRSLPESTATPAGPPTARPTIGSAPPPSAVTQDTITIARDRWDDLRIRLARAEAEASERALALADARLALRALTAGPAKYAQAAAPTTSSLPTPATPLVATPPAGPTPPALPGEVAQDPQMLVMGGRPAGTGEPESAAPVAPAIHAAEPQPSPPAGAADVMAARARAAQTGGHVPAGAATVKKRRWWQSAS